MKLTAILAALCAAATSCSAMPADLHELAQQQEEAEHMRQSPPDVVLEEASPLDAEPWSDAAANATNVCTLGTAAGCSTAVADGITRQIVSELNSMGYSFTTLSSTWTRCSSPCINSLQTAAANSLASVAQSKNDYITLNSAFRSAAQQYLLYRWQGTCGITIAARPGTSNHEGGLAVDLSSYTYWKSAMEAKGWRWYGSGDAVHFDYLSGTSVASANLKAFQRLWNRNNPAAKISEDGVFGPATEAALKQAPCSGW